MKTAYMSVAVDCLHPFMTQFGPTFVFVLYYHNNRLTNLQIHFFIQLDDW